MLDCAALIAMAFAGYAGASAWLVLLGALALSIEASWAKVALAQQRAPLSNKKLTYVLTGAIAALCYAAFTYVAGAMMWRLLP